MRQVNPKLYQMFEEMTFKVINAGRKHFGAKTIIERIRWYTSFESNEMFKVNNNDAPYLARLFEERNPQYKGFFRKRRAIADIKAMNV